MKMVTINGDSFINDKSIQFMISLHVLLTSRKHFPIYLVGLSKFVFLWLYSILYKSICLFGYSYEIITLIPQCY